MQMLQEEAQEILTNLGLLDFLAQFGEAQLVGSVALDLIVKLDLDVHLLVDTPDLFSICSQIYPYLLDQEKVREVRITDWRVEGGLKLGVDVYSMPSGDWSIDIWVTDQLATTAFAQVERLLEELTPEHRAAILTIKQHYYRQGLLRDGISSRIYTAVLDSGVRSVAEFEATEIARSAN